jgi:hypothetical protein
LSNRGGRQRVICGLPALDSLRTAIRGREKFQIQMVRDVTGTCVSQRAPLDRICPALSDVPGFGCWRASRTHERPLRSPGHPLRLAPACPLGCPRSFLSFAVLTVSSLHALAAATCGPANVDGASDVASSVNLGGMQAAPFRIAVECEHRTFGLPLWYRL